MSKASLPTNIFPQLRLNAQAFAHNFQIVRTLTQNTTKIIAMVKANAYGHDAPLLASNTIDADYWSVARYTEAEKLSFLDKPLIVNSGPMQAAELLCTQKNIQWVIHTHQQVEWIQTTPHKELQIWLKFNIGMNRLGFSLEDAPSIIQKIQKMPHVQLHGFWGHLPNASMQNDAHSQDAGTFFLRRLQPYLGYKSLANSAAIYKYPELHADIVRPGIMLYGASPFGYTTAQECGLQAVGHFCSTVLSIQDVWPGQGVGYDHTWIAPPGEKRRIAIVACGYADGYPRNITPNTPVMIKNKRYPIVGRVCMDLLMVDCNQDKIEIGEEVTLWGNTLPAEEIAACANTIPYTLFTSISNRVQVVEQNATRFVHHIAQ